MISPLRPLLSVAAAACLCSASLIAAGPATSARAGVAPDAASTPQSASAPAPNAAPGTDGVTTDSVVKPTTNPDAGTVLGSRPASHAVAEMSSTTAAEARTFTYQSTRSDGVGTPVTGTLFEPNRAWKGKGPRPTIVFAPGTRGQGDQCAPSRAGGQLGNLALGPAGQVTMNVSYEYPFFQIAAEQGIRVVVTDYIGLGTKGHHSYVNHVEEAHAVLDAARAGLSLADADPTDPVGFAGYSQGGGAAAAAAEYAGTYAPDLNIKGTYAGAPPADLYEVMNAVDGSAIAHVLGYAINGFAERSPRFYRDIVSNFNPWGRQFLRSASGACISDSVATWAFVRTNMLTKNGESFAEMVGREPMAAAVLEEQKLGKHAITGPMLVSNSRTDDIIPYRQAKAMAGDYCGMGGTVKFEAASPTRFVPGAGVEHAVPMFGSVPRGLDYLIERFNDVPAPDNCQS